MDFSLIFSQIINGLQTGSVYALVALGYSMVYGIILLLNFAHGDIIMVGAYTAFYAITSFHLHPLLSVVLAVAVSTVSRSIGISFLLENGAQLLFGADTKSMDTIVTGNMMLFGTSVSYAALLTIVVSIAAMVVLTFLVQKTKLGKAMRAVSEDILYLCAYPQASPAMGSMLGLKAFVAAVLGGIGSIPGAMIGGFVIGLLEAMVSAAGLSVWKDGAVFAILIVVLLVKPTGILGRQITEKV